MLQHRAWLTGAANKQCPIGRCRCIAHAVLAACPRAGPAPIWGGRNEETQAGGARSTTAKMQRRGRLVCLCAQKAPRPGALRHIAHGWCLASLPGLVSFSLYFSFFMAKIRGPSRAVTSPS